MFSSFYFAPAILETTNGETVWEVLPRLFYRPSLRTEIEVEDFFCHEHPEDFVHPRFLVDAPSRADLEIDEAMVIHLVDLLSKSVGFTARSTHLHNESYLDPYFVPALVAHGVHFRQLDQRGIPYIDRVRQAFLNAEVANSVTDIDEETNEVILAASWLSATPYLRHNEFYRKITIDDIDYWNIEERIVNVLRKLDWKGESQVANRDSLASDSSAKTVRLAYLAELSSRPIKIPPVQDFLAAGQGEWLPTALEQLDKYQFEIQSEILELGIVAERDDWFYQCVEVPPTSMRGPFASDESEIQIKHAPGLSMGRWTIPVANVGWVPGNIVDLFENPSSFDKQDGATQIGAVFLASFLLEWEQLSIIPPVAQIDLLEISQFAIAETSDHLVNLSDLPAQFVQSKISMVKQLLACGLRISAITADNGTLQSFLNELTDDEMVYLTIVTQSLDSSTFLHWLFAGSQNHLPPGSLSPHFWELYKTLAMAVSDRGKAAEIAGVVTNLDAKQVNEWMESAFRDGIYVGSDRIDFMLDVAWKLSSEGVGNDSTRRIRDTVLPLMGNSEKILALCRLVWDLAQFARHEISVAVEVPYLFLEFRIRRVAREVVISCFAENDLPSPLAEFGRDMEGRGWNRTPFSLSGSQRIGMQFEKRSGRFDTFNFLTEFVYLWCRQNGDPWSNSAASVGSFPRPFQVRAWSRDQWVQLRMNQRIGWITSW